MNNPASGFNVRQNNGQWGVVIGCGLLFTGFVASRAMASMGMMVIVAAAMYATPWRQTLQHFVHSRKWWVMPLYFVIVLVSGTYSADTTEWMNWIRIKLPYLFLPLSFAAFSRLEHKKMMMVYYLFIVTFLISTSVVLGRYWQNYSAMTEAFLRGNAIQMPFSHIRYTLMLAFSFFIAIYLFREKKFLFSPAEKWLQAGYAVFVFAALHILSVRSGLLALYAGLLLLIVHLIIAEKRWYTGSVLLVLLIVSPFAAYKFIPSLQNKLSYMKYDREEYSRGEINYRYDAMRITSMKAAIQLWKENMVWGVGAGDLRDEMNKVYERVFPQLLPENRLLPHNQWAWVLASAGLVGFALFAFAFFYLWFGEQHERHLLFSLFNLIVLTSFFTEATLEEQMGTGFYVIFLLLLLNQMQDERKN